MLLSEDVVVICSPKAFLDDRETAAGLQVVSPGQGEERTMPRGRSPESVWSGRFGEAILDDNTDEVSSAEDEQANKEFYARAFKEWAAGNIDGDAQDIFDAVTAAIET